MSEVQSELKNHYDTLTIPQNQTQVSLWIGKLGEDGIKGTWGSGGHKEVIFRGYIIFYADTNNPEKAKALGRVAIRGTQEKPFEKQQLGIISILGPTSEGFPDFSALIIDENDGLIGTLEDVFDVKVNHQRQTKQRLLKLKLKSVELDDGEEKKPEDLSATFSNLQWGEPRGEIHPLIFETITIKANPTIVIGEKGKESIFYCSKVKQTTRPSQTIVLKYKLPVVFINCCNLSIADFKRFCQGQFKKACEVWGNLGPLELYNGPRKLDTKNGKKCPIIER